MYWQKYLPVFAYAPSFYPVAAKPQFRRQEERIKCSAGAKMMPRGKERWKAMNQITAMMKTKLLQQFLRRNISMFYYENIASKEALISP
ncbi:MAG: hypothetical protein U0T68_08065 [Ferruginibacter sp.]